MRKKHEGTGTFRSTATIKNHGTVQSEHFHTDKGSRQAADLSYFYLRMPDEFQGFRKIGRYSGGNRILR